MHFTEKFSFISLGSHCSRVCCHFPCNWMYLIEISCQFFQFTTKKISITMSRVLFCCTCSCFEANWYYIFSIWMKQHVVNRVCVQKTNDYINKYKAKFHSNSRNAQFSISICISTVLCCWHKCDTRSCTFISTLWNTNQ